MTRKKSKPDAGGRTRWVIAFLALTLVAALAACGKPREAPPPWKVIDAPTLKAMMGSGKNITLINTMSEIECLDHRIPGSRCVACEEIEANAPAVLPADKDQVIVLYCESAGCYRSCRGATAAIQHGYRQIYVLDRGMPAWKQAGYSMESIERIPRVSIPALRASTLKEMLAEREDLFLLDVRSEKSYKEGHIVGAVNIPMYRLSRRYAEIPLNRTVILIDDRGFRTFLAGSYLDMKGYRVMRLFGGMQGWEKIQRKNG
jgi:rhodanese-related sulfurtransferase